MTDLLIDLAADDPAQYRSLADTEWQTVRGKRNRIAIGTPSSIRDRDVREAGTAVYNLAFSVTFLPDQGCRFRSVDVTLDFGSAGTSSGLPRFVHLEPASVEFTKAITVKRGENAKASASDAVLKLVKAEVGTSRAHEESYERVEVALTAFGLGTGKAGWRFKLVDHRDIAVATERLQAQVIVRDDEVHKVRFSVAAQIDVHPTVDRLLTRLFVSQPSVAAEYTFGK